MEKPGLAQPWLLCVSDTRRLDNPAIGQCKLALRHGARVLPRLCF